MNQKGIVPIFIIAGAVVVAILILMVGLYVFNQSKKDPKPVNNQSVMPKKDCIRTSLGGCDEDKDFYKWTDDGLP